MNYPTKIIALDFETSGLVAKYDQITQIGCVVMENGEVIGAPFNVQIRLNDTQKISKEVLEVQFGVLPTWEDVAKALKQMYAGLEAKDAFAQWNEWAIGQTAKDLPVVAWNAAFDFAFYGEKVCAFTTIGGGAILGPTWVCAKTLFRRRFPDAKKVSLDAALLALGITGREAGQGHDGLQDAILCGRAYFKMLENQ